MRATVTLEKAMLDELVRQTNSKSMAAAVQCAIKDYLRRKNGVDTIHERSHGIRPETDEIRHHDR